MDQNKEKERGNISTLTLLFLERRAGLFWDWMRRRGLEGGTPAAGAVCAQIKTQVTGWQLNTACDALTLRGADRKLLPSTSCSCHPAGDRLVPHFIKEGEVWKRRAEHRSSDLRHARSLLAHPFVYCLASPAGILGDQRLPAFLHFTGCFSLSPFINTWLCLHVGTQVSPANTDQIFSPYSNMYLNCNCLTI